MTQCKGLPEGLTRKDKEEEKQQEEKKDVDKGVGKMADIQIERTYQKQPTIFQNKKRVLLGETDKKRSFPNTTTSTPNEATEGTYIDKKCPCTHNISIQGRISSGSVTKMKMP
ncbi:hypothetical protein MC885_019186, partial [Smutsia gigantea]